MSLSNWLKEIDKLLIWNVGLTSADLEDFDWFSYFEDKYSPEEVVEAFIEEYPEYNLDAEGLV